MTNDKKIQLVEDYENWWEHKSNRPMIQVNLSKTDKSPCATRGELLDMLYNYDIPASTVAKEYRKSFDNTLYMGDSFPVFYMRSTGILGAMLGQTYNIDVKHGTIWYEEMKGKELEDIQPILTDDNKLLVRSLEITKAFEEEFGSDIALGIPNLGGMMDIVESMRGANNSLMDLYDDPDEVIRLNDDIYNAFEKAYRAAIDVIDVDNILGYTGWLTMLSKKPYFISQCDFCCMIGKNMFEEFVAPTLDKEAKLFDRSFYHLDGPGAVKHLDRIIECGFDGIQWIPGAGAKPLYDSCWDHIYKKIYDAGLLMELTLDTKDDLKAIDHVYEVLGTLNHVSFIANGKEEDKDLFIEYLDKYGVPH